MSAIGELLTMLETIAWAPPGDSRGPVVIQDNEARLPDLIKAARVEFNGLGLGLVETEDEEVEA